MNRGLKPSIRKVRNDSVFRVAGVSPMNRGLKRQSARRAKEKAWKSCRSFPDE